MHKLDVPFLFRTPASPVSDGEAFGDLTLHSSLHLTPEEAQCTPASAVEVHRDSEPGQDAAWCIFKSHVYHKSLLFKDSHDLRLLKNVFVVKLNMRRLPFTPT